MADADFCPDCGPGPDGEGCSRAHQFGHALASKYLADVEALLGESPEAWKGALVGAWLFGKTLDGLDPDSALMDAAEELLSSSSALPTLQEAQQTAAVFIGDGLDKVMEYAAQWIDPDTLDAIQRRHHERSIALLRALGVDVRIADD